MRFRPGLPILGAVARTYRVPHSDLLAVRAFSAVWIGVLVAATIAEPYGAPLYLLFALFPLGYLFVFTRVTVADDGTCEFRSFARRRRTNARQIATISTDEEAIYVHDQRGKIHMWETDDFDELLARLLRLNPAIELKGWIRDR